MGYLFYYIKAYNRAREGTDGEYIGHHHHLTQLTKRNYDQ